MLEMVIALSPFFKAFLLWQGVHVKCNALKPLPILSLEAFAYLGNHHFGRAARVGLILTGGKKESEGVGDSRINGVN